ncbi:VWFA and cache domain-containing protein 1 [Cephus cinctus]|uniref:VWFA and cache domain-containing protein 1 n=1 Tax=Cephus cinctus TaxID=211228 RepID=A0AAJ7C1Y9_CEPCN|nr:VWFA and cache domain-containing protein 1 [Cephus cinctus]XP_015599864.1 VWFA and cache domain-containing protein 1 [Cephus cinctus]XP_015599866.1 VWFA and cache domain-containing protein 1 [Cephus cinctus]XP_024942929.1 VWFA and cache domain-containing protein 1 [Cephus cinctus]
MAVNGILYFILAYSMLIYVEANDEQDSTIKCQFGKPLRNQIEAEPLDGTCLREIVVEFSRALSSISDEELGVTAFQGMLDKLQYVNVSTGLEEKLGILVDKLNAKLKSYVDLIRRSNDVIQPILLRKQNDIIYPSQNIRLELTQNRVTDICSQIVAALATNLRGQEWKYLHVLPVNQPGTMCGPPSLAHNIGPLLLSRCSSKNVILLLEHGIFMSEGDLALAQITAKTVVDMLSETDHVSVVGLVGHGSIHCKEGLLRATDINKLQLARHIESITRTESNETLSIDFKRLMKNITGEIVVIHLTNTLNSTSNVKNIINTMFSDKLITHLRTILILSDMKPHSRMKEIYKNDNIITLPTQNVLGYEIARLFSGLKCINEQRKDYYLSDPYFEPYSKTMTLSVGQITNVALLSLDVKLRDFLEDITYFHAGSNAYGILFDKKEIVWMHKNFPRMETMMEQPLKVYLRNIENIEPGMIQKMMNEFKGSINVKTNLGIVKRFTWKHLSYDDIIVCIVSENYKNLLVTRSIPPLPPNILHHRLDLMSQSIVNKDILCTYQNRIATLSTGVVYLAPWCFQSPMEQLKLLETGSAVTVQSYMAYIKDSTRLLANPGLHPSVRPDVATLSLILNHFKQRHMDSVLNKFIVRRYVVATGSGVLEVYPGMVLDSGLDPKRRAWYGKAMEHPGKLVLSTPYLDAGGAGYIVTLSHTVYKSQNSNVPHTSSDPILAVLSLDVTMGYISRLLSEMYPFCDNSNVKCFLMDDKGYLISHPSLLDPTSKVEQQHLTHKELLVATDILDHKYFVKKKLCASYLDGTTQRYYQFNTSLEEVLTNIIHGEHCVKYQIAAVPGTNMFLGVVNVTCNILRAFCPCSTMDRSCLNCQRMEQTECECPCECALYSAGCTQYNISGLEPCPAPYEQGVSLQTPWAQSVSLKSCPSFNCKAYETMQECLGVVGCQWCFIDSDGESLLQTPFCSDMSLCFKGIFGSLIPYGDGTYNSHSTDEIMSREWPSVGPVAGGILAFVLVLGITLFCYRLRTVQSGLEHQCLHVHTAPDTLRMSHLDGDAEPMELDQTKGNLDSLLRDAVAPISPYRVSTNYRRPPGGDSDHGYSTMTPHDDSEQQPFAEPLLIVGGSTEPDLVRQIVTPPSPTTHLGSPHHVLAPVTVHRNMETNYC